MLRDFARGCTSPVLWQLPRVHQPREGGGWSAPRVREVKLSLFTEGQDDWAVVPGSCLMALGWRTDYCAFCCCFAQKKKIQSRNQQASVSNQKSRFGFPSRNQLAGAKALKAKSVFPFVKEIKDGGGGGGGGKGQENACAAFCMPCIFPTSFMGCVVPN